MPFPESYVNGRTVRDMFLREIDADLDANTIKVALFTNSVPQGDKNGVESYGSGNWSTDYEVASSNYTPGGITLTNPTISTPSNGRWVFEAGDVQWSNVTFEARGALVYNASAANRVLAAINFGENKTVIDGTFSLSWDAENKIFYMQF